MAEEESKEWTVLDKSQIDAETYIQYKVKKNDSMTRISFLSGLSEK